MNCTIEIKDGILIVRIPVSPILKRSKLKIDEGPRLTRREEEVLRGILQSKSNKEIANDLNLAERTVKFHVSSILAKFKVTGRVNLVERILREEKNRHALPASLNVRSSGDHKS